MGIIAGRSFGLFVHLRLSTNQYLLQYMPIKVATHLHLGDEL